MAEADRPGRRDRLLAAVAGRCGYLLLRALGLTWRVRVVAGAEHLDALLATRRPTLVAYWHDRLLAGSWFLSRRLIVRGYPLTALISPSRDGELAARIAALLGAEVVRGSASRGGSAGVRGLLRAAAGGRGLVIIPDGPRGPARRAKAGAAVVAQLTGLPIVPFTWSADRVWRLRSWDGMEIPKPFARLRFAAGEPIPVPRRLEEEELARHLAALESTLADLEDTARRSLGG